MSIQEDEQLWKLCVGKVYLYMRTGKPLAAAKNEFPFAELDDSDRDAVFAEAIGNIEEVKTYLRKRANLWFWCGGAVLMVIIAIVELTGVPDVSRNMGRMWLGIAIGAFSIQLVVIFRIFLYSESVAK